MQIAQSYGRYSQQGLFYREGEQCGHSLRGNGKDGIKSIGRKPHWD